MNSQVSLVIPSEAKDDKADLAVQTFKDYSLDLKPAKRGILAHLNYCLVDAACKMVPISIYSFPI